MNAFKRATANLLAAFALTVLAVAPLQAATYFYHTDHLGTPQALTDENQQVVWQGEQDPFGENSPSVNVVEQNLRFPGQYFDVETGLHYNIFRTYDSAIGRYTQSDPLGLYDGANLYGYASGDPLRYSDPYGLFGMDSVYGAIYTTTGWIPSQGIVDRAAGFGDGLTVGITDWIRDKTGGNGAVNKCSAAYSGSRTAGNLYTLTMGVGRLAYAGLAKGYSITAPSAAAASAGRHKLRRMFGNSGSLRPPNTSKYTTAAELRYAAGKTNPYVNAAGAVAAVAAANDIANGDECECK